MYNEPLWQTSPTLTLPPRSTGHFKANFPPSLACLLSKSTIVLWEIYSIDIAHWEHQNYQEAISHSAVAELFSENVQNYQIGEDFLFFLHTHKRDLYFEISMEAAPCWLCRFWGKVMERSLPARLLLKSGDGAAGEWEVRERGKLRLLSKSWQRTESLKWTKRGKVEGWARQHAEKFNRRSHVKNVQKNASQSRDFYFFCRSLIQW